MEINMDKIVGELKSHESNLQNQLDTLTAQSNSISQQLEQVRIALSALIGKSRQNAKPTIITNKKSPSPSEIEPLLLAHLEEKGPVAKEQLYDHLESRLLAMGKAKFGLKAKFAKVTLGLRFERTPDGLIDLAEID